MPTNSFRLFLAITCALLACDVGRGETLSLIADPHFERGFRVRKIGAPPQEEEGFVLWNKKLGEPVWVIAQWHSKGSLLEATAQEMPSGRILYETPYKALTVGGKRDGVEAELGLTVNGEREYGGRYRGEGRPWPHLLVAQKINLRGNRFSDGKLSVEELHSLHYHMEARLRFDHRNIAPGHDPPRHSAQFSLFLVIRNYNRRSPGFGDYLWFGMNLYDDRKDVTKLYVNEDTVSGKLIYQLGMDSYDSQVMVRNGAWFTVDLELLEHLKNALRTAWERGFLADSQDFDDYGFASVNLGWEVTGLNHTSMEVRNLSLTAKVADIPDGS